MEHAISAPVRRPADIWIVGIVSLLWNAFGAFDYLATHLRLDFYMSQFTAEQLAYFESYPAWAVAGWTFGVWGALAGSVGLLLARRWAVWAFALSLAGLAVSSVYMFALSDAVALMGPASIYMSAIIWIVAIALLWYSVRKKNQGVLV